MKRWDTMFTSEFTWNFYVVWDLQCKLNIIGNFFLSLICQFSIRILHCRMNRCRSIFVSSSWTTKCSCALIPSDAAIPIPTYPPDNCTSPLLGPSPILVFAVDSLTFEPHYFVVHFSYAPASALLLEATSTRLLLVVVLYKVGFGEMISLWSSFGQFQYLISEMQIMHGLVHSYFLTYKLIDE